MYGLVRLSIVGLVLAVSTARGRAGGTSIELEVDATDLSRNIVRVQMHMDVHEGMVGDGGELDLYYPVWVPGNHGPSGPVGNVVDIRITDCDGAALLWDRDPTQVERITVYVPDGCDGIDMQMGYIASQPRMLSQSSDTYGRATFGGLNWNTVVWYPGGMSHQEIMVRGTMRVPNDWKVATSLETTDRGSGGFLFERTTLAEYIDSPVVMGRYLQTTQLETAGQVPHWFHTVADEARYAELPGWLAAKFSKMVMESVVVFGDFPRKGYHFLYLFGEDLRFGLEHGESTFMGSERDRLKDAEAIEGLIGGGDGLLVVPHEYVHVWCGKLRAPEGMVRDDFHTAARTDMLWVYEGLTSYYDEVLAVRSGLSTFDEFAQNMLDAIEKYERMEGRLWRSVEDTARHAQHLRDRGKYWLDRRRAQDYYGEGALFWLEADAIIRRGTDGARSLDDFCRLFFDVNAKPVGSQDTYSRGEIVDVLGAVYPGEDWDGLIRSRIERPRESLDMGYLVEKVGYRVEIAGEMTKLQKHRAKDEEGADHQRTLGIALDKEGVVTKLVPDSLADDAGLGYGMRLIGVNGWVYSAERIGEAVEESSERGRVELMVSFADRIEMWQIPYDGGARFPRLVHAAGEMDVLGAIASPRTGN